MIVLNAYVKTKIKFKINENASTIKSQKEEKIELK
jgi:hypothetical protein